MTILILGNGAREHALAWKLSQSPLVKALFVAPGNAGTALVATNLPVDPLQPALVVKAAQEQGVNLVFVGPEGPLEAGVVDALQAAGIAVIGPDRHRAQLESSKVFSKNFMLRNGLPTARAQQFSQAAAFVAFMESSRGKIVVKKSGLAAGKGVLETSDHAQALAFGLEILKTDHLLVEEFLTGWEISVFVLSDGLNYVVLPPTADFKKALENDEGPNTGGMGAICPVPTVTPELWQRVVAEAVEPTVRALNKEGLNYKGVIFIGLMITAEGPKILEYNTRLGDPETQVLMPLIESDFAKLVKAMAEGTLAEYHLEMSRNVALGVVVAAGGYPGAYREGASVTGLPTELPGRLQVFHASTTESAGQVFTGGGRCFTVVSVEALPQAAQQGALAGCAEVRFDGAWYRKDIGTKFLGRLK